VTAAPTSAKVADCGSHVKSRIPESRGHRFCELSLLSPSHSPYAASCQANWIPRERAKRMVAGGRQSTKDLLGFSQVQYGRAATRSGCRHSSGRVRARAIKKKLLEWHVFKKDNLEQSDQVRTVITSRRHQTETTTRLRRDPGAFQPYPVLAFSFES
jgi:hypothetical protein